MEEVYSRLYAVYGPQHWWPGKTPFEVIVGAILVQNTAWRNVVGAIRLLKRRKLLRPRPLYRTEVAELQELIRGTGYFRLKERRLRSFLEYLFAVHGGSLKRMFATGADELRRQLLSVHGIGPETADSILLYAGQVPSFVVDTYTQRVFKRHGWLPPESDYHATRQYFSEHLPADAALYNEYHALLVRVGHHHCRKTPRCEQCPLAPLLPADGPLPADR